MNSFLNKIMNKNFYTTLTICGSAKFRRDKEKYQAYYTIHNNLVFAPVNYLLIKWEEETSTERIKENVKYLACIHDKKIEMSDAIIVVNNGCYIGNDTMREIIHAREIGKKVLYTNISEQDKNDYYFNNNSKYPLYMAKEID